MLYKRKQTKKTVMLSANYHLVILLLFSLLFIMSVYRFFLRRTHERTPENGKVLISARIMSASLQGVEDRETFICPFAARRRLEEVTRVTGKRCVLEREGSTWTLHVGSSLVMDVDEEHGDTVVHYFLDGAPTLHNRKKSRSSDPPRSPILIEENGSIDLSRVKVIYRVEDMAEALKRLENIPQKQALVVTGNNNPHDTSYYAIVTITPVNAAGLVTKQPGGWRIYAFQK